jgi:group I intron endonuclease
MIGIYSITNIANGKKYIGQSVDVKCRLRNHKWALRHKKHYNDHLQKSFNKYGENYFIFDIICECEEDKLDELERYYISYYDCMNPHKGYNAESGGNANKHWSEELTQKMKEIRSGENSGMWGKHHTEETKAIMREKALGRVMSDEAKAKSSISHKGKLAKPLYCIEANIVFPSSLEAAEFAGLKSRSSIFENIAGRKSYAGRHPETGEPLHWMKLEDKIS